jgi:hypothetical protein
LLAAILTGVKWNLNVVLIHILFMAKEYLLGIGTSSLDSCSTNLFIY